MSKSEKSFHAGTIIAAVAVGAAAGIIVYILSAFIAAGSSSGFYSVLTVLSCLTGILAGLLLMLFTILMKNTKHLKIFKEQATTDKLTELYNRSFLDPFLDGEIDAADKTKQQVSVIMVDLDHFKEINDTYGHVVGDHVLTIFAQVVLKCMRKTDIIARYGGDEFIVVLPRTDTETARTVADRIRKEVSDAYIPPVEEVVISSMSCSIGISTYPVLCDSKSNLIRTSDLALYKAKHSGRNCTIVYQNELLPN